MKQPRQVQCIFYSHIWSVSMVKHAGLGEMDNSILVELGVNSNIAPMFRAQAATREGLAGLLAGNSLKKLGKELKSVPAPLILAPRPAVPAATLESAVSLLSYAEGEYEKITLLVHISDVPRFAGAYHHVDQFSVLWDIADFPDSNLVRMAKVLVEAQCITRERWRGFHFCNHPRRQVADFASRKDALLGIVNEFPQLTVAA